MYLLASYRRLAKELSGCVVASAYLLCVADSTVVSDGNICKVTVVILSIPENCFATICFVPHELEEPDYLVYLARGELGVHVLSERY